MQVRRLVVSLVLLRQWMQYIAGNISSWRNQSSQLEHARSITRHTGPRASIRLNFEWLHQSGLSTTRINYGQRGVLQLCMSKASHEILTVSSSASGIPKAIQAAAVQVRHTAIGTFWRQGNLEASRKQKAWLITESHRLMMSVS